MIFEVPTVDRYFALCRTYRNYIGVSPAPLKDYGCMACIDFLESAFPGGGQGIRILELGHGFSPKVIEHFQDRAEVWGVDDNQGLHYFDNIDWEKDYREKVLGVCPKATFVRGLVGSESRKPALPEQYFDAVLSISVLEEVPELVLKGIVTAAAKLLKPGGWLLGTHDLNGRMLPGRISSYLSFMREAGLEISGAPDPAAIGIDWEYALVENPTTAIHYYQQATPEEERRYLGHWATLFTAAQKVFHTHTFMVD